MSPRLLSLVAVVAALLAARGGFAQVHLDPRAQQHVDAALKAYETKAWDVAINEFETAYSIDPNPALLYATAQAYRFANRCSDALVIYHRYLETHPNASQTSAAQNGISLCEQMQKQKPAEPVSPPPPSPTPPIASPAAPPATAPPPTTSSSTTASVTATSSPEWYRDPLGDSLVGGGAVAIGVGIVYWVAANNRQSDAAHAQLRTTFVDDLDEATTRKRVAGVAIGIGAALAAGGVYVFIQRAHDHSRDVTATTDGHSLIVAGHF
ncbi:MAG TPA: hypothetical protein VMJ10_02805 [Kofleriaceae bacterium]|nr:hypothetical protein [Kofleriaceae bacterium]